MASFRTGFKIFGEISLKQGLGRIRSFSESKKPAQWLPEDQWAVRQPQSTCPDLCVKKKKTVKTSKSWLSLCKDPDAPKEPECDVRHNNCPPPPIKQTYPWYSLDRYMPKAKPVGKPPPLESCCEARRRGDKSGDEEVCCSVCEPQMPPCISSKMPPCVPSKLPPAPAPVVNLSCPIPKELNLMMGCDCGLSSSSKISPLCQNDRLPYDEFKPQKTWKPPPFSLPCKYEPTFSFPPCSSNCIPFSEFKFIDVPKPMYTRYKSVELCDPCTLLNMTDVQCAQDGSFTIGITPHVCAPPPPLPVITETTDKEKEITCPEKRVIEAACRKPVKLKKATKFCFTPKPTKLIERRVYKDCFGNKKCDLPFRTQTAIDESDSTKCESKEISPCSLPEKPCQKEEKKKKHHQVCDGHLIQCKPPKWMYNLCKPGSTRCPLLPCAKECDTELEADDCELDAPKDIGKNDTIVLKPPPIPTCPEAPPPSPCTEKAPPAVPNCDKSICRFVLMPEQYKIKLNRDKQPKAEDLETTTVEKLIERKATPLKTCTNPYQPIKENILYDLQRLCPEPPVNPSKINTCRKPPIPICPQAPKFHRSLSTLAPLTLRKLCSVELCKSPMSTNSCGDSSGKCKARSLLPKRGPCPDPTPGPDCADVMLPCCPKARVPPNCNVRKPMPLCKKILPPKPSFSECCKDPLPCPKPTECKCWEKGPNKKN